MKRLSCILVISLLIIGMLSGCSNDPEDKNFRYRLASEPVTLDPQIATGDSAQLLIDNLYEGLVRLDADGNLIPGMATKWEVSEDGTTYTFYIHHNTRWSDDKTLVTAEDFVFGVQRALDPATRSTTCEPLFCIKNGRKVNEGKLSVDTLGIKALNTFTLEVTLEKPTADFLEITMLSPFMPCNKALFESSNGKYGLETETTHTNGPFRLAKNQGWKHDTSIRIVKSELYRGYQAVVPAQVLFLISDYPPDPLKALSKYDYDVLEVTQEQAEDAKTKDMQIKTFEDTTWVLCFNTSVEPFNNANIRKALVLSLNREKLLENLEDGHTAADYLIPPITTFSGKLYSEWGSSANIIQMDEEKSVDLRNKGLSELDLEKLPDIKILHISNQEQLLIGSTILEAWQAVLGQSMNLDGVDTLDELQDRVLKGDYQIAIYPLQAEKDGPYSFLSMFSSQSMHNPAHLKAKAYDGILKDAEDTTIADKAAKAYFAAEAYLNDNAIVYPLFNQGRYYAMAPTTSDIILRPFKNSVEFILAKKVAG